MTTSTGNLDHNQQFPNQLIDGDSTECVALTVTDIAGNIDSQLYDPDMLYADCLYLMNERPTTAGLDPYSGFLTAVAYGCLPISLEDFTAKVMGELYVANIQNYTPQQQAAALHWAKNGVVSLPTYQSIVSYLQTYKCGVGLAMTWYSSFLTPNQDGTLPALVGSTSNHMVAVYEADGALLIKPWLGKSYGANGYALMTETTYNLVKQGAWGLNKNAWRWFSLAQIAVTHPTIIGDILPQLGS